MKIITAIICFVLLSVSITKAQTSESAKNQYLTWKKQVSTTLKDYDNLYTFRIGVASLKVDNTHAKILITVVGRTPNYYFTLQPIQTSQFFDTNFEQDKTGKSKEWGAGQDTSVPRLGYLLDFTKTVEFDENTNAIFVSVKPVPNTGQPVETTILKAIIPLGENWNFEEKFFYVPVEQPK